MITGLTIFDYIDAYYPLALTIVGSIVFFKWWISEVL